MKTCAFTGHRPKGLGYPELDERCAALKEKLRALIIRMIEEEGVTHFISGMAQGVDMYAAEMLMYGKEASNRKQEIDRQHYTIPNQRPKDKHCGKI